MEREGCYIKFYTGRKGLRVRTMHLPDMHSLTFFRFRTIQKS